MPPMGKCRRFPNRVLLTAALAAAALVSAPLTASGAEPGQLKLSSPALKPEEAKALQNPFSKDASSADKGKRLYQQFCVQCHGEDGKAQFQVVAAAADLTVPAEFKQGSSDGEIFRSIRDGAGLSMPPFKGQIKTDDDLWHLVNYVRSLSGANSP